MNKQYFRKRHYNALAEMMKEALDKCDSDAGVDALERLLKIMIRDLKADNIRFQSLTFLKACGYTEAHANRLLARYV